MLSGDPGRGWIAHSWTGVDLAAGRSLPQSAISTDTDEDPFDEAIPVPDHP